jgi:peroxiredoxin
MPRYRVTKKSKKKPNSQVLGMALMGVGLLIIAGLLVIVIPMLNSQPEDFSAEDFPSAVPVPVDFPAPDVTVTDINGQPVSLREYQGQVLLVNNWAIWCPPCRAEMPILEDYYRDHQKQNFTVIGIESGQESEDVQYHVDLYKLTFPVWLDLQQTSLRAFQNSSLPNSYVIDKDGQVRLAWTGAISRELLEKHVTPLLED